VSRTARCDATHPSARAACCDAACATASCRYLFNTFMLMILATTLVFILYWYLTLNIDSKDVDGSDSADQEEQVTITGRVHHSSARSPSARQVRP
jgi:hypothetical protein